MSVCNLRIVCSWQERDAAHRPLLEALQRALPDGVARGARVLVPGAGLGRLAWEVAALGFTSQGSEFSYHMLIAANFVLNDLQKLDGGSFVVHPWILQVCTAHAEQAICSLTACVRARARARERERSMSRRHRVRHICD